MSLIQHGAFGVLTAVMAAPGDGAAAAAAADILGAFLCHDAAALRAYLMAADGHALFDQLVDRFVGAPHDAAAAAAAQAAASRAR